MTLYTVTDEAMCEREDIQAESPDDAIRKYVADGYLTVILNHRCEEVNARRGTHYTTLHVWQGDDVVATRHLIADGSGGVLSLANA